MIASVQNRLDLTAVENIIGALPVCRLANSRFIKSNGFSVIKPNAARPAALWGFNPIRLPRYLSFHLLNVELPEIINEVLPDSMKAESAMRHFLDSFILCPTLTDDAVDRAEQAAAVRAVTAVDKKRRAFPVYDEL